MRKHFGIVFVLGSIIFEYAAANRLVKEVTGSPFLFSPPVIPDAIPLDNEDVVWWPTNARPPKLKRKNIAHLMEDRETLIHTDLSYPNPFVEPERCVAFARTSHTWLCDPDGLMTQEEQSQLESRLLKLRDTRSHKCPNGKDLFYQAAVAVATDIVVPENENPQQATEGFAHALLKRWGVGNKGCHDGILLLYVKNLRTVAIATRSGVEIKYMNDDVKRYVQRQVHSVYLLTGSIGEAMISGVDAIIEQLPAVHEGIGWIGQIILIIIGVYVLSVALIYFLLHYLLVRKYGSLE